VNAHISPRGARVAITSLVVLDLIVLAGFSVRTTSTTIRTVTPLPVGHQATSAAPRIPPVTATSVIAAVAPIPSVLPVEVNSASAVIAKSAPENVPPAGRTTASTPPAAAAPQTAACPIPLKKPSASGGLQSLIDLAPAFGPFSAEAFAAASAYQPLLQLLGPILAKYPALASTAKPLVTALLTPWESLLNTSFGLLSPFYAPYRQSVLSAETKLAAFFAPYAESLTNSPLGGCLVDLEAALVADTR